MNRRMKLKACWNRLVLPPVLVLSRVDAINLMAMAKLRFALAVYTRTRVVICRGIILTLAWDTT